MLVIRALWIFLAMLLTQGQKAGLHLDTNGMPQSSQSVTAPPNLQPFFDNSSDSESQSNFASLKVTSPHPLSARFSQPPIMSTSLTILLVSSLFFSFHRAESGGVSALRPAHALHPSLSQTQHLSSSSTLWSMCFTTTSLCPSYSDCSASVCSSILHLGFPLSNVALWLCLQVTRKVLGRGSFTVVGFTMNMAHTRDWLESISLCLLCRLQRQRNTRACFCFISIQQVQEKG